MILNLELKILLHLINSHDIVFNIDGVDIVQEVVQDVGNAEEVMEAGDRVGS
jgi:hypothetical protein